MSTWRKDNMNDMKSMRKRMEAALDNDIPDISHDVTFIVGEEKAKISCHKLFLMIASPVFEKMFSHRHNIQGASKGTDSEQNNGEIEGSDDMEIRIPDLHPVGLKNLIKYVYTDVLNVDVEDALATMHAAHKYDIPELTEHCSNVLKSNMSNENVLTSCQAAILLNDKELEEKSWNFIELNAGAMLDSEELLEFSEENFCKFLKLDDMENVKSEVDIFNTMLKWGKRQCERDEKEATAENLRQVLKKAIPLIRFPTIKINEFNDVVQPSGMLNDKECIDLYKYFTNVGEARLAISKRMGYSSENRTGKRFVFCSSAAKCANNKLTGRTGNLEDSFKVTGNAKLKAIGIVIPPNQSDVKVNLSLYDPTEGTWTCAENIVSNHSQICYIEFDTAIHIKADVKYLTMFNNTNAGKMVDNPVTFVRYSKELMNSPTTTWNTADKQQLTLTFSPWNSVTWALQLRGCMEELGIFSGD